MKQNRKVRSGNETLVIFDGKQIGMIQSVRANDSYGLEAASGIGDIHVQEHVPTVANHSLSVSSMVLIKGAMLEAGIATENGDAALQGLVFNFESYDKATGALLRKYVGCSYDSGDMDISAHRIMMQSAQFKALDVVGTAV
jgi:hypothetical protein